MCCTRKTLSGKWAGVRLLLLSLKSKVHVYIFTRREDRLRSELCSEGSISILHPSFLSLSDSLCLVPKDRDYRILHQDKQGNSRPLETVLFREECERQLVRILAVMPSAVQVQMLLGE